MRRCLVASLVLVGACYNPNVPSGLYECGPSGACPAGLMCVGGCCVRNAADTCGPPVVGMDASVGDAGGPRDMTVLDTTGGCADPAGRSTYDPGWGNVAFCNGEWAAGGILSGRTCGTFPDQRGKHGATDCTIADLCSTGWHVCSNSDLSALGHNKDQCKAVGGGFWVSSTSDDRINPMCSVGSTLVWGCGTANMITNMQCSVLFSSMDVSDCAMTTGSTNPFNCSVEIAATLTKTGPGGGGAMCCKD